jgi:hypothetical protein
MFWQRLPGANDIEKARFWRTLQGPNGESKLAFWQAKLCFCSSVVYCRCLLSHSSRLRSRVCAFAVGSGEDRCRSSAGDSRGAWLDSTAHATTPGHRRRDSAAPPLYDSEPFIELLWDCAPVRTVHVQRLALITVADTCNLWPYLIIRRSLHGAIVRRIRSNLFTF